jgi:hypothetical protein
VSADERLPDQDDAGIEDLEADADEAEQVTGGRLGDPCDGGE